MKSHSFACKWKQGLKLPDCLLCITLTFIFNTPWSDLDTRSNKHFIKNLESNPLRVSYKASTIFMVFPYLTSRGEQASIVLVFWQFSCISPCDEAFYLWGALLSAEAGGIGVNGSCSSSAPSLPGKQAGHGSLSSLYASPMARLRS